MAVVANETKPDTFDFVCERVGCIFESREWPEESQATLRGEQHEQEHTTGTPMPELVEFEQSVGYVRNEG